MGKQARHTVLTGQEGYAAMATPDLQGPGDACSAITTPSPTIADVHSLASLSVLLSARGLKGPFKHVLIVCKVRHCGAVVCTRCHLVEAPSCSTSLSRQPGPAYAQSASTSSGHVC
jgi:hypothetical protein